MSFRPHLERVVRDGISLLVDPDAATRDVVVAFTDRRAGHSRSPYDSLNLSAATGDDPGTVARNRDAAAAASGLEGSQLVSAQQVHGTIVAEAAAARDGDVGDADAIAVRSGGHVATILSADCVPIVIAGDDGVVAAHAGRRGLVGGVIEAAVAAAGAPWAAWVGPCIHACCYEVGPEVVAAFEERDLPVADPSHVDPGRAAVAILYRLGVAHVASSSDCTSCDARYFSYRRDGVTGRQGVLAGFL
jgi:YfiH family protein